MMGILRTILFAATGLQPPAQPLRSRPIRPRCSAPSANMRRPSRRSRLRPMRLRRSAAKPSPVPSSEISVGYEMRPRGESALEQQKGDGGDFGRFSAGELQTYLRQGPPSGAMPVTSGGAKRNVVWNASSGLRPGLPLCRRQTPSAGISPLKSTLSAAVTGTAAAGLPGRWRPVPGALHEYRDSDPRIRNVAMTSTPAPALPCGWGTTVWGFRPHSASTSNRVPRYSTPFRRGEGRLPPLGPRVALRRVEGNANSQTRYRGSGYGLTLALVPDAGRGGLHLARRGTSTCTSKRSCPAVADLVLQKVVPRSVPCRGRLAEWHRETACALGRRPEARYDYRRGDEGIVDDNNSSQGSGTLGFLTLFEYSALQGRADAVFGVEAAGHAWYVCPWGEYRRRTSDYLYPAQNMEFTRAGGGVDFRCVLANACQPAPAP